MSAHALKTVQVRLKLVSNEGYFTSDVKTVFRLYLPYDCSGVTEKYHKVLPAHDLQAVRLKLMSVSIAGRFTLEAETVSRPYLP
jgi:hypothetical protein